MYARLDIKHRIQKKTASARLIAALAMIGALLLGGGGCALLRGGSATGFVAGDARHLRLPGAADTNSARPVAYRSPYGTEEYARSPASGRAEALYLRSRGTGIALDIDTRDLERLTRRWQFQRRASALSWSRPHTLAGTTVKYRLFRRRDAVDADTRACVAFIRTWAFNALDPLNRPARSVFGYHCAPPGRALPLAAAKRYLRRVAAGSPAASSPPVRRPDETADAGALALATGRAAPGWGLQGFPVKRFRHYPIGGVNGHD